MNATNHSVYDELIRRKKFDSFSRRTQEEEAFENLLSRWRCRNFYISTYGQQIKIKFFSIRYRDLDRWDRQGHRTILRYQRLIGPFGPTQRELASLNFLPTTTLPSRYVSGWTRLGGYVPPATRAWDFVYLCRLCGLF